MKLTSAVLTSAFVMFATASQAADINSPFYLPSKGKMLSETSMEYTDIRFKDLNFDGWYAKQTLTYGITNNISAFAAIGNTFDNKIDGEGAYNNSHNFDYTVGLKYNHHFDRIMTQLSLAYNTFQPSSFWSEENSDNWNKYVNFGAKIGYDLNCGALIPYIAFNANYGLNTVDKTQLSLFESPYESKFTYSTYAGIYSDFKTFSTDFGIQWDNVRHGNFNKDVASRDDVYAKAAVNYNISNDMSVGVYGDYLIGESHMPQVNHIYTVGANFKVAF